MADRDYIEHADTLMINQKTVNRIVLQIKRCGRRNASRSAGAPTRKKTAEEAQQTELSVMLDFKI